jgi:hypothetical protein
MAVAAVATADSPDTLASVVVALAATAAGLTPSAHLVQAASQVIPSIVDLHSTAVRLIVVLSADSATTALA